MIDYLIVGQGYAGSLLAHQLLNNNKTVKIFDASFEQSASSISSGIINPITGRNLVKSWRIDSFLEEASLFYSALEENLGERLYYSIPLYRIIKSPKDFNDYNLKSSQLEYANVLGPQVALDESKYIYTNSFEIKQSKRVDIPFLCSLLRNKFLQNETLVHTPFLHKELKFIPDGYSYQGIEATSIIFCEGAEARFNPFFDSIPFVIAKGESLLVEVEGLHQNFILHSHKLLCPWKENTYWFGATFEWDFKNNLPTPEKKLALEEELGKLIKLPFTTISHNAALRPTIKDRRPVLGEHPVHKKMFVFNGLGTKAASLMPFLVNQMTNLLFHHDALDPLIDYNRFLKHSS